MKQVVKKVLRRMAPQAVEHLRAVRRTEARVEKLEREIAAIGRTLSGHDDRLDILKALVAKVEPYQPAYNVAGIVDAPRRESQDRCLAIENADGPLAGKRILDVGSSLGYVSFYCADRGARVEGWESNPANAEVSRAIGEVNGIDVDFKVKELNDETIKTVAPGQFDVALVLNVFHHITHHHGLEYTQKLVQALTERIPLVIVELAKKGEDGRLFWNAAQPQDEMAIFELIKDNVDIKRVGEFGNHLSKRKRPLYVVSKKTTLTVGSHVYDYDRTTAEAYQGSPLPHNRTIHRKYYFAKDYIIKEYGLESTNPDNLYQIMAEVNTMVNVAARSKVYHVPHLRDFEIDGRLARVVIDRISGELLSDLSASKLAPLEIHKIAADVLRTLSDLNKHGIHHNDVRSWNTIYDQKSGAWLIDYGHAGPVSTDDDIVSLLWMLYSLARHERESYAVNKTELPPRPEFEDIGLLKLYDAVKMGERSPAALGALLRQGPA